jgi:hypothetical protein
MCTERVVHDRSMETLYRTAQADPSSTAATSPSQR